MVTHKQPPPELHPNTRPFDENVAPRRRFPGTLLRRRWVIGAAAVVLIAAVWAIVRGLNGTGAAPRYLTAPVAVADISATVEETGTVNPVNEVSVGTQVSGTINGLSVDFNSTVRRGQVLATLDPTSFQASAMQAHGALEAAKSNAAAASSTAAQSSAAVEAAAANARQATANVQAAAANLTKAQAQLTLSHTTVARDRSLLSQGFIAQSQLDTDVAADRANDASVNAARSALAAAQAQAAAASAQVNASAAQQAATAHQAGAAAAQAQATEGQVQQADYNLARAVITSPIDGIVVSRSVSIGQTVAASFQTPTLFVIASSLKDMQVDVSVSEADVGQLRPGAAAQITVPAYPNVTFLGTVKQVRVNPTTVQNVVTYDAIVAVHDDSARLKPGMTADVTIAVATARHVLAIPAAALLFRPTGSSGQNTGAGGSASSGTPAATPAPVAGAPGSKAVVWILRGDRRVDVPVVLGMSDGSKYEVRSGKLNAGDRVIVGQLQAHAYTNANPMGAGPGFGR